MLSLQKRLATLDLAVALPFVFWKHPGTMDFVRLLVLPIHLFHCGPPPLFPSTNYENTTTKSTLEGNVEGKGLRKRIMCPERKIEKTIEEEVVKELINGTSLSANIVK